MGAASGGSAVPGRGEGGSGGGRAAGGADMGRPEQGITDRASRETRRRLEKKKMERGTAPANATRRSKQRKRATDQTGVSPGARTSGVASLPAAAGASPFPSAAARHRAVLPLLPADATRPPAQRPATGRHPHRAERAVRAHRAAGVMPTKAAVRCAMAADGKRDTRKKGRLQDRRGRDDARRW